jgi:hypothetical protein
MALSIISTLISNTQFTVIAVEIANIEKTYTSPEFSAMKASLESGSQQALLMAAVIACTASL